jgi:hypothetical protein
MQIFSLAGIAKALLVAGVMAVTAVGASSYVSAQSAAQKQGADPNGYAKDQCKNGGWEALGFRNQGQCVSFFARGGTL